jgi:3-oxoacyl-[acyl-carrier-protein] synthase-3
MSMSDGTVFLRGASYVLGEVEADYTAIDNLVELADRFQLAPNAGLWGWGGIRTTPRELEELAIDTGAATLRAADLDPSSIDALLLCSNRIPGPAEGHGRFVADVLTGIGLGDIPCYGASLNRCVNLLAGLDVSRALVVSGRYRGVLVITTDKVAPGADRMSQFALFSDGAASCVVAADAGAGDSYELLGCATAQDAATLDWTNQISSDLAREVNDRLLTPHGLKLGDIAALLHANLFKPLVVMKERQAGFSAEQLYTGNIPRIGHCFAADPLINLVDRAALGHVGAGSYCMLAASVPGSRIGALLRRVR